MQVCIPPDYQFTDYFRRDSTDPYFPDAALNIFAAGYDGQQVGGFRTLPLEHETLAAGLWVDPEHRRQGVGSQLVRNAIRRYGTTDIRLKVNPFGDKPMLLHRLVRFYAGFGFLVDTSYRSAPVVMVRRRQ